MAKRQYDCLMSDLEFGTHEYGFIPRIKGEDPDDEDLRYQRFVQKQLPPGQHARCVHCYLTITEDA